MAQPQLRAAQTDEVTTAFKRTVEDILEVLKAVLPLAATLDDLTEICQLALQNPTQLKLLLKTVTDRQR